MGIEERRMGKRVAETTDTQEDLKLGIEFSDDADLQDDACGPKVQIVHKPRTPVIQQETMQERKK